MWTYYRNEYVSAAATIEAMYPEVAKEPQIAALIAQTKSAELMLDKIMTERCRSWED